MISHEYHSKKEDVIQMLIIRRNNTAYKHENLIILLDTLRIVEWCLTSNYSMKC